MRQFDLNTYLRLKEEGKEPRIVTRDGHSARIVCTDMKVGSYPVLALFTDSHDEEETLNCTASGRFYLSDEHKFDLFFADLDPEPTYRPYKDVEECFKDVVKHGGWIKNTSGQYLHVLAVTSGAITYSDSISFPFERACRYWVWADDNSPVGAREGEGTPTILELEDGRTIEV